MIVALLLACTAVQAAPPETQPATRPGLVLRAADFGAIANDGQDDAPALQAALRACAERGASRLELEPGRYDLILPKGQSPRTLLVIDGMKDFTLDGRGAELILHGVVGVLTIARSGGITVQNITIDSARAPFSLGEVIARGDKHFDVRIAPEYPVKGNEPVVAFMDYDLSTGLPATNGVDVYFAVTRTESVGPQVMRVHTKHDVDVRPGMQLVLRHQVYDRNALIVSACQDITLRDVTIYSVPGMGLYAGRTRDMTIERMRVQPRPGSGHLISATADATHFNGCLGTIAITDSHFDGMGDDAINIKTGLYLKVLERVDDHTVLSMHNLGIESLPAAGDTMEFIRTATLIPYAEGKVASASIDPDKRHRVRFVDPLPPQMEIGDVLGNATTVPRVRIRGCTVQRNRARGFLLQTRDVLVEDCTFRNCTSGGIFVMTETVHFYEAIGTRDVTVRRCTFDNCSYTGPLGEGVLLVGGYAPNFALPPEPGVHRNIRLEDNVIRGAHNAGIFVAGADGIVIRGNVIENTGRRPTREECRSGIFIMSSRNVEVTNNRLSGLAEGVVPFRTGPNLDLTTLQVRQNSGIPSP